MTGPVNPMVAPVATAEPSPWAGAWIAEDIEQIAAGVQNGSWVAGALGVVGGGLDALALVSDPVGALLQYGVAWLIEHVKPLSEALDWLAGDPAQIAAHTQTWRNVAVSLAGEADGLDRAVRWDTTEWSGVAADAYRAWATEREQSVRALGRAADTMALMTEGAGLLIGTVRLMVRDAVAVVVSRLMVYAGELIATAGLATPLVVEQVTSLCAAWGAKIARWLRDLIASLRRLLAEGGRLSRLIETIKASLRERRSEAGSPGGPDSGGKPKSRAGDPDFDAGRDKGPMGASFQPGVFDDSNRLEDKERKIAERLAAEGEMVHPRERIDNIQYLKNPDAMVRAGPDDVGTITEFKTLETDGSGTVRATILRAASQVSYHGGGDVVLDGRDVGLLEEVAQRGYARAAGQAHAHGSPMPIRVRVILGDGRIVEFP